MGFLKWFGVEERGREAGQEVRKDTASEVAESEAIALSAEEASEGFLSKWECVGSQKLVTFIMGGGMEDDLWSHQRRSGDTERVFMRPEKGHLCRKKANWPRGSCALQLSHQE